MSNELHQILSRLAIRQFWLAGASLFATFFLADSLSAHEFKNGYVERTLSIVVRDRTVELEYAVGCNPLTMESVMEDWSRRGRLMGGANESRTDENHSVFADSLDNSGDGLLPPLSLEAKFQAELLIQVARQFVVKSGSKSSPEAGFRRLDLKKISVGSSPRHHVNAVAKLEIELPEGESLSLSIQDTLFSENASGVRCAAKSLGNTLMSRSNVAPILIRAERHEMADLTPEQRLKKTRIECQLIFVLSD